MHIQFTLQTFLDRLQANGRGEHDVPVSRHCVRPLPNIIAGEILEMTSALAQQLAVLNAAVGRPDVGRQRGRPSMLHDRYVAADLDATELLGEAEVGTSTQAGKGPILADLKKLCLSSEP